MVASNSKLEQRGPYVINIFEKKGKKNNEKN